MCLSEGIRWKWKTLFSRWNVEWGGDDGISIQLRGGNVKIDGKSILKARLLQLEGKFSKLRGFSSFLLSIL